MFVPRIVGAIGVQAGNPDVQGYACMHTFMFSRQVATSLVDILKLVILALETATLTLDTTVLILTIGIHLLRQPLLTALGLQRLDTRNDGLLDGPLEQLPERLARSRTDLNGRVGGVGAALALAVARVVRIRSVVLADVGGRKRVDGDVGRAQVGAVHITHARVGAFDVPVLEHPAVVVDVVWPDARWLWLVSGY